MVYPVRVRPEVEAEIVDAMAWYQSRAAGIDLAFFRAFLDVLGLVQENPELYRKVRGEVGRVIFRKFPYAVFYVFDGHEVVVLACLHERRSPDMWPRGG